MGRSRREGNGSDSDPWGSGQQQVVYKNLPIDSGSFYR